MKKLLFSTLVLCAFCATISAQTPIAQARLQDTGTVVTIKGVTLNNGELGTIRYIQDATGGLPGFQASGTFISTVKRGDIVTVTGKLKNYNSLLEIDPVQSFSVESSNNALPAPIIVTPLGVGEATESKLVKVENATFALGGSQFAGNTNYTYTSNGETGKVYVRNGSPLVGTTIPLAVVSITGISSQFNTTYQLLPRDANDIVVGAAFYITTPPAQGNITNSGFSVAFSTNLTGTTQFRYGTSATALTNEVVGTPNVTAHTFTLSGLQAAEFYYVQGYSVKGTDTAKTNVILCSTASNSTGVMKVYFNHDVDASYAVGGAAPAGISSPSILAFLIGLINNAQSTIDCALYNNDQTTLVDALKAASARGVRVRYAADQGTANIALNTSLPFSVVKGNATGLMHNKFVVVDAATSVNNSWVLTGALNFTTQNMTDDYNNSVFIQDQALAKAYAKEMDEMWGGTGNNPGVFVAKFGDQKTDNTPHRFKIGGIDLEMYFSPTDGVTQAIANAINTANSDLEFGTLTFTMNALGTAVKDRKVAGVATRGIIEQINDQGSEYPFFITNNVNVRAHTLPGLFHHKYAIIDATNAASDPTVVTGSHNWSASAETRNDENTVIIHDAKITNIFIQEFEKRWAEVVTGIPAVSEINGLNVKISPNPASDFLNIELKTTLPMNLKMTIYDMNGRAVRELGSSAIEDIFVKNITVSDLASGSYLLLIQDEKQVMARQIKIVR